MPGISKMLALAAVLAAVLGAIALYGCLPGKTLPTMSSAALPAMATEKGFTVFAAGDIADCRKIEPAQSGAARTAALIEASLAPGEDFAVLALGDTTYPVGLPSEYADCYEPTWGRFKARTYPAPGNHEYYSPEAFGYYSYFGKAAGADGGGYYSFDLGSWHIVSLNSQLKPDRHAEQLAWLADDLKHNRSACTLAFWHHPRFSSGGHGNNERMQDVWKALAEARADIVLAAHDHNYERFAPLDAAGARDEENGTRSFVVGTGGAWLTPILFKKWHSETSDNNTHGVLRLNLARNGYSWEFLPVGGAGFTDRGAARCHRK